MSAFADGSVAVECRRMRRTRAGGLGMRPCSPRRRTSRSSSGEFFIRSGAGAALTDSRSGNRCPPREFRNQFSPSPAERGQGAGGGGPRPVHRVCCGAQSAVNLPQGFLTAPEQPARPRAGTGLLHLPLSGRVPRARPGAAGVFGGGASLGERRGRRWRAARGTNVSLAQSLYIGSTHGVYTPRTPSTRVRKSKRRRHVTQMSRPWRTSRVCQKAVQIGLAAEVVP